MATEFPANTVSLIIALMIVTGAGMWFILSYGLQHLPVAPSVRRAWRWGIAIVLTTWLLSRLLLSVNPPGAAVLGTPYSLLSFTFLVLGLLVGISPLLISSVFRQIIRAVPETWQVGIHAIRIGGFVWLALEDMQLHSILWRSAVCIAARVFAVPDIVSTRVPKGTTLLPPSEANVRVKTMSINPWKLNSLDCPG